MEQERPYALITGASSGIGWHISLELAARNYSLVAVSNQADGLNRLKEQVERDFQVEVVTLNTDLAVPGAAQWVFEFCEKRGLEIQVLVNNAGVLIFGEVIRVPEEEVRRIFQLHVVTLAELCRCFAAGMADRRKGYILNVASTSAVMPYPVISLYGPSKTFIRAFTRALRFETRARGIGVTCLLPGATATPIYDDKNVNVPLAKKLGVMVPPERVARRGVKALFAKRAECIPGIINTLIVRLLPWVPYFVVYRIYRLAKSRTSKPGP